jgi:nucleoside-diphosphate-sugar epimerase
MNRGNHNEGLPEAVEVLIADRRDQLQVRTALEGREFDAVFDIVGYYPGDVEHFIEQLRGRIRNYVFISTGSVYKAPRVAPLKEHFPRVEDDTQGAYGWRKRQLEDRLLAAHADFRFPVTIIRPGYIYGPHNYVYRERFFFDRLLLDRPVLVPGDGTTFSQFGHVDDLARLQALVLEKPAAIGEDYNFVGEYAYTLDHFVELVGEVVGKVPRIVHFDPHEVGLEAEQVSEIFPFNWSSHKLRSMAKAQRDLGYDEEYSLREGLATAFEQYLSDGLRKTDIDLALEDEVLSCVR